MWLEPGSGPLVWLEPPPKTWDWSNSRTSRSAMRSMSSSTGAGLRVVAIRITLISLESTQTTVNLLVEDVYVIVELRRCSFELCLRSIRISRAGNRSGQGPATETEVRPTEM